jgi:hypothetical protein
VNSIKIFISKLFPIEKENLCYTFFLAFSLDASVETSLPTSTHKSSLIKFPSKYFLAVFLPLLYTRKTLISRQTKKVVTKTASFLFVG